MGAERVPDGFALERVAEGLDQPVALEFAPDGRLFIAQRTGEVFVHRDGVLSPPFARVEVWLGNEAGLLGMALDPDFGENGHVYVFATVARNEQRILRFTETADPNHPGWTLGGELTVIRDRIPASEDNRNGGALEFGPDGMLYVGVGDTETPDAAQDLTSLAGKILRLQPDGQTPSDNPFLTPTGQPRATYASGFRQPFRMCFGPDGRLFVFDVGSDGEARREEINLVSAGGNYGWPLAEGASNAETPGTIAPLVAYSEGGAAPTGGVVYTGNQYPADYAGDLFHAEYVLSRLYRVALEGDQPPRHEVFLEASGGPTDLAQGPDGALYFCEINSGKIMRLRYVGSPAGDAPPLAPPMCGACGQGALLAAPLIACGLAPFRRR